MKKLVKGIGLRYVFDEERRVIVVVMSDGDGFTTAIESPEIPLGEGLGVRASELIDVLAAHGVPSGYLSGALGEMRATFEAKGYAWESVQ